ncbi:hypothetical protein H7169_01370 [Candidatus Gracilibacteria bacterium]|nr:hypothetical protein [Candidatus Gracilibacteria bacterium]
MKIHNNLPEKCTPEHTTLGLIGDLDGNMSNFLRHLRGLELIKGGTIIDKLLNKTPTWTGGSMRLILSGDILADRSTEGFAILKLVNSLREEAELAGGTIDVLAGNHEEKMIGFLVGRYGNTISLESQGTRGDHRGIIELLEFGDKQPSILANMRKTEKGKMILDEICNMSLILIQGDTIHSHTPMSRGMLDSISALYKKHNHSNISSTIDHLNSSWNILLSRLLLEKNIGPIEYRKLFIEYIYLAKIFLHPLNGSKESIIRRGGHPDNRIDKIVPYEHPAYSIFLDSGVYTNYHGHTDDKIAVLGLQLVSINHGRTRIKQAIHSSTDSVQTTTQNKSSTIVDGE